MTRLIIALLLVAVGLSALARPAAGRNTQTDQAMYGISAGGTAVATGFFGPLGLIGGGGYEVGYGIGCLIWHDPADTINAGVPVDLNDFLGFEMPPTLSIAPSTNPSLAAAVDAAMDDMDGVVALSRALHAARDRYEGALLLGRQDWAADRWTQMVTFNNALRMKGHEAHDSLDALIAASNALDPSLMATVVTKQMIKDIRDQVALGSFPAVDSLAISSWSVSTQEMTFMSDLAGDLQDTTIDSVFQQWDPGPGNSTTYGFLLDLTGDQILESCFDPSIAVVGGISHSVDAGALPVDQSKGSSGPDAGLLTLIIGGITAGAVALGGAGWYARRRWLR